MKTIRKFAIILEYVYNDSIEKYYGFKEGGFL
jgi:hypothetical protein